MKKIKLEFEKVILSENNLKITKIVSESVTCVVVVVVVVFSSNLFLINKKISLFG